MARFPDRLRAATRRLRTWRAKHVFRFKRKWLFETELSSVKRAVAAVPIAWRSGDAADVLRLDPVDHDVDEEDRRFSLERIAAGDRLFIGEADGQIVFYGWARLDAMEVSTRDQEPLPPGVAYVFKLLTSPRYRNKGIMKAALSYIAGSLVEAGCSRAILWIYPDNVASIRATLAAGFRRVGSIYDLRILGLRWSRVRRRAAGARR